MALSIPLCFPLRLRKIGYPSVIILDNASFHRSTVVRQLIETAGYHLEFLPVYSPDLNPIEPKWVQAKAIRRQKLGSVEELFALSVS